MRENGDDLCLWFGGAQDPIRQGMAPIGLRYQLSAVRLHGDIQNDERDGCPQIFVFDQTALVCKQVLVDLQG